MIFPYQNYELWTSPTFPDSQLYRPEVPIRVIGELGERFFFALADTGADGTLLPRSIGNAIGAWIDE